MKRCPLHPREKACGCLPAAKSPNRLRQVKIGWLQVRIGVHRAPDGREKCSKAELARRKNKLLQDHPYCAACGKRFNFVWEAELGHIASKGMQGWKEDSRMSNLVLLHKAANWDQGSMDLEAYLREKWKPEICRS